MTYTNQKSQADLRTAILLRQNDTRGSGRDVSGALEVVDGVAVEAVARGGDAELVRDADGRLAQRVPTVRDAAPAGHGHRRVVRKLQRGVRSKAGGGGVAVEAEAARGRVAHVRLNARNRALCRAA